MKSSYCKLSNSFTGSWLQTFSNWKQSPIKNYFGIDVYDKEVCLTVIFPYLLVIDPHDVLEEYFLKVILGNDPNPGIVLISECPGDGVKLSTDLLLHVSHYLLCGQRFGHLWLPLPPHLWQHLLIILTDEVCMHTGTVLDTNNLKFCNNVTKGSGKL